MAGKTRSFLNGFDGLSWVDIEIDKTEKGDTSLQKTAVHLAVSWAFCIECHTSTESEEITEQHSSGFIICVNNTLPVQHM